MAFPERWKALALVASSIPKTMSEVAAAGRITSAINHPDRRVGGAKYAPSANIRYTSDNDFLIARALKRKSNEASRELCRMLIADPRFMGKDFSIGDQEIFECAEGTGGVGSGWTWRRRDTRHHIEFTLQQLANLF